MIAGFFAQFGAYILGAVGLIAAFVFHGKSQKKIGAAEEQVKSANATSQEHEAVATKQVNDERAANDVSQTAQRNANEATATVVRGNDGDAANELRNEWSRDK